MKKILSSIIISLIILTVTGCDSFDKEFIGEQTTVCTKNTTGEGVISKETITINSQDDKIEYITIVTENEMSEEDTEFLFPIYQSFESKFDEVDGVEWKVEKISNTIISIKFNLDYSKIDLEKLKETFENGEFDHMLYSSNNVSVTKYINEELEGFKCK